MTGSLSVHSVTLCLASLLGALVRMNSPKGKSNSKNVD